ncbi:hypothetical protein LZ30DRAFT_351789 [Colletotrichum cereale]|nr:hypothetical protein LZ30DRAFT_351789 [Colletotrichum cereale]
MLSHSCFSCDPVPVSGGRRHFTRTEYREQVPLHLHHHHNPNPPFRQAHLSAFWQRWVKGSLRMPCYSALEREGGRGHHENVGLSEPFPGIFCLMCQVDHRGWWRRHIGFSPAIHPPPSSQLRRLLVWSFSGKFLRPADRADDDDSDGQSLGPCHSSVNSIGNVWQNRGELWGRDP